MNKKLLAVAMAGLMAAPVASYADAKWYGRIHTAVTVTDADGGDNSTDVNNRASRFGVKGSEDLGNGLKAVYRYEFGVASDIADIQDNNRLSFVGLSGSFGTLTMGRVWSTMFNMGQGPLTFMQPGEGREVYGPGGGTFRISNALSLAGGSGNIKYQIDAVLDGGNADSDGADEVQYGIKYSANNMTLGLSRRDLSNATNSESTQAHVSYKTGSIKMFAGYLSQDDGSADNYSATQVGAQYTTAGGVALAIEFLNSEDDDAGIDNSHVNFQAMKKLSKTTLVHFNIGMDDVSGVDTNKYTVGLRKDF